ncbi:MAG: cytidine deaminase [Saprospiraceae bacterium]
MKKEFTTTYNEFESFRELSKIQSKLLEEAYHAYLNAYAPYSNFRVGAAVLLENDKVITGFNQENASYPCGMCAERVALYSATAQFPSIKIISIAICCQTFDLSENPPAPCGMCRQVLHEFETHNNDQIEIILGHPKSKILIFDSCSALLPFGFDQINLKRNP